MEYTVKKITNTVSLKSKWDDEQWAQANVLELKNYMGQKPEHFPKTQAKLLYDSNNIYVFFRVEDNYIRAVAEKTQDIVCCDSCAEFFFTPGEDLPQGYFNVEINCGGTMLLYHQTARDENKTEISQQDCQKIKIYASMPKKVEPEIQKPTVWTIQYSIPFEILEEYAKVTRPNSGVKWRANFYKCGDETSHPHWLTWSFVNEPKPDFHQPCYFGTLCFE